MIKHLMYKKINKGDSKNRYRLSDRVAIKLGVELNKSKRYRLSKKKVKHLMNMEESSVKRLFYDIETVPGLYLAYGLAWQTSIKQHQEVRPWMICVISYKWQGSSKVHRLVFDQANMCDKKLVEDFVKVLNKADEIVAHNGDKFDIKKIRTRAMLNRVPMRPIYKSYDTLKKSRSFLSTGDNRLDALANMLGVGAKLPHQGWKMWKGVAEGDKKALKAMGDYCDVDVIVLEDVYDVIYQYGTVNIHEGVLLGNPTYSCKSCGHDGDLTLIKNVVTPAGTTQRIVRGECGHEHKITNAVYQKYLKQKLNLI